MWTCSASSMQRRAGGLWISVWHPFSAGSHADAIADLMDMAEKDGVCSRRCVPLTSTFDPSGTGRRAPITCAVSGTGPGSSQAVAAGERAVG